jgi:SpoVK/Ycf46/Vps4 family AAA+-type ATPase
VFGYAAKAPSVLFFDEFDVIGKRRDDEQEVGELKRVVGSFLQILDSHPHDRIVVAATNHHGLLDEALWRRFDDVLTFPRPSADQVLKLLQLRLRGTRKAGMDLSAIAARMDGFTFADAERVCLESMKAMLLRGNKELTEEIVQAELTDQRVRLREVGMKRTAEGLPNDGER